MKTFQTKRFLVGWDIELGRKASTGLRRLEADLCLKL